MGPVVGDGNGKEIKVRLIRRKRGDWMIKMVSKKKLYWEEVGGRWVNHEPMLSYLPKAMVTIICNTYGFEIVGIVS